MRSSLAHIFLLLLPGLVAALLFGWFGTLIQQDHLGGGIALLFTIGGLAIGLVVWIVGAVLAVPLKRPRAGLSGISALAGSLLVTAGSAALAWRWFKPPLDPFAELAFNWPFLAGLSIYAGLLTMLGAAVLQLRSP